jgi:hypothetical protein
MASPGAVDRITGQEGHSWRKREAVTPRWKVLGHSWRNEWRLPSDGAKICIIPVLIERPARVVTDRHAHKWLPGRQDPVISLKYEQIGKKTSCLGQNGAKTPGPCSLV